MKTICPPLVLCLTITLFMLGEMRAVGQAPTVEDFESTDCGTGASATGDCSAAIGDGADANNSDAIAIGSGTNSYGESSLTFGVRARALEDYSLAIGFGVVSNASNGYVLGVSAGSPGLTNSTANTFIIGMNSDLPTFYMSDAGGAGNLSNIGIGTTTPGSRMHINGDLRLGVASSTTGRTIFQNSTNANTLTIQSGTTSSSYTLTLPTALGTANQLLSLTSVAGSVGTLGWANGGGSATAWDLAGNTATGSSILGTVNSQPLRIYAGGAERIRVLDSDGNVGIGTTAPNALLHLKTSGSTELRVENVSSAGTLRFVSGSDEATISQTSNKDLVLSNNKSNKDIMIEGNDGGTLRQMVYIDASATRVGIGDMSDPSNIKAALTTVVLAETETREKVAKFMVSDNTIGRVQFDNRTDVDNEFGPNIYGVSTLPELEGLYFAGTIETGETSGSTPVIGFDARILGGSPIPADTRPLFNWSNNNSSRMLMDANGNLGIGTTSPGGKLHVNGTVFINPSVTTLPSAALPNASNEQDLGINSANGQLINLTTSSILLKENVEDIQFDHDAFFNLRVVDFNWKPYYGGNADVGMIAQEVAETFPALASWSYKYTYLDDGRQVLDSTGIPVVDTTQIEVSGVRYHKLPVYLFAVQKEQRVEIIELRQQVQEMAELLNNCCTTVQPMNRMDGNSISLKDNIDEFVLLQNDPNPFSDYTDIKYHHDGCASCEIVITDLNGRIVKRIKTSGVQGTVRVYSSEIGAGLFSYSLVVEGKTVRSERMVSSNR